MSLSKILLGLNGPTVSSTKISRVPVDLRVTDGREVSSLGSPQVLTQVPALLLGKGQTQQVACALCLGFPGLSLK